MTTTEPKRLPMIFAELPRCACGGVTFRIYGRGRNTGDDDAVTKYVRCDGCKTKFAMVIEYVQQTGTAAIDPARI